MAGVGGGPGLAPKEGGQSRVGGDRRVGDRGGQSGAVHGGALQRRKWAIPRGMETRGIGGNDVHLDIGGVAR